MLTDWSYVFLAFTHRYMWTVKVRWPGKVRQSLQSRTLEPGCGLKAVTLLDKDMICISNSYPFWCWNWKLWENWANTMVVHVLTSCVARSSVPVTIVLAMQEKQTCFPQGQISILYSLYKALQLFATRFAACARGIQVSFMQSHLFLNWYKMGNMGDI